LTLVNSFDYSGRQRPGLPNDRIATFGLVGPTVDLSHRHGTREAAIRLEAVPILALVTSLAFERYAARSGTEGLKSALAKHGYYYAYGLTLGGQLALRFHTLSGGFEARWQRFGSIEGLDRFQERLTRDLHQTDGRVRSGLWLSLRPLGGVADIGVTVERTDRFGTLDDLRVSTTERRATLTLGFVL
jgi:hypothetical protein